MLRSTWFALLLCALGLWASLVPQVTYQTASSGELSSDVLLAWPGYAIQQDLGSLRGTVGGFQYWASAEAGGPEVSVHASLVDATTLAVLRQKSVIVTPAYIPIERSLTFPGYVVPFGQQVLLQLQVAEFEKNFVAFRLAVEKAEIANVKVNGVPDAARGPLAFRHIETGSGLRAAIHGEGSDRVRAGFGIALSALALLVHPRSVAILRRASARARSLIERRHPDATAKPGTLGQLLTAPWYPWPAVVVPILHFLTNNDIHFSIGEASTSLIVALVFVSGSMIALRFLLGDWHRPAAATTVIIVIFFGYGHLEQGLNAQINEQLFFGSAVVVGAVAVTEAVRANALVARWTPFFNAVTAVLLVLQAASLAGDTAQSFGSPANRGSVDTLTTHLFPSGIPPVAIERPDIYYIILDAYGRDDALVDFDNSAFLRELEGRGFQVASRATSNYVSTPHALASSLNMSYLHELEARTPASHSDMMNLVYYNSLAAILKSIGYTYVHLESGHQFGSKAPLSDVFVSFGPSGTRVVTSQNVLSQSLNPLISRVFVRELIRTTALRPVIESQLLSDDESTYDWWSPHRALRMFEFLSKPIGPIGPKFVFAHISKPKSPATFDRHGNLVLGTLATDEFSDDHDPSVPNAYTGQLIYVNSLVLRLIDDILKNSESDPIIVIAGDHNRRGQGRPLHPILAAFHLPNEGEWDLPEAISSVNHFRYILRSYFKMDISLLEDRTILHSGVHWDFTASAEGRDS